MHMKKLGIAVTMLGLSMLSSMAAETNEVEVLRQQLKEAQERLENSMREHREVIKSLTKRLDTLQQSQGADGRTNAAEPNLAEANRAPATAAAGTPGTNAPAAKAEGWSPSQPIPLLKAGSAYMNISFVADVNAGWSTESDVSRQLEQGHHDPLQRGFSLRSAELALDGAVDPYFKGFANIGFALDEDQETELELEEAYLLTTALPGNLQAKAGQFFADFGRHNSTHPHTWAFVDQPLVITRFMGPDALRNVGGQVSWLAPTPFYMEGILGVFNGQGEQAFSFRNRGEEDDGGTRVFAERETLDRQLRGPGDLLFVPRLASSFDITSQQTVLGGLSAAFGPNDTGTGSRTEIYGADLYWKWKSAKSHGGFPFVGFQTEGLYRRFEAGSGLPGNRPEETLRDWGFYAQLLYGFHPGWVVGMRGEYVDGDRGLFDAVDLFRGERVRLSPNLTWYPSEFSKLRLQYNYDKGEYFGHEHSVWLQLELLLGAHGAHKF